MSQDKVSEYLTRKLCSKRYGLVLGVVGLLGLQNYSFAFLTAQKVRARVFPKEYMESTFGNQIRREFGPDAHVPGMGYPDMGAGPFSKQLAYKDWFEFNNAQRVHSNSLEQLAWSLPAFLIAGIFFPRLAASLGGVVFVGRELYRYGYMTKEGPSSKIREMGAIPLNVAQLTLLLCIGFIGVRYMTGGFLKRRKLIKKLTMQPIDRKIAEVIEKEAKKKQGWAN
ncbi:mapeg family protein [Stylonychia lemnae]|uniref:Mapeg family protein n=1 Tax=Stylonychia lemnae TaxID=5949 RepID=A0A077ZQJ2_STYLE|nr:mapeg family protein [Stylonychia lemnae]|eukprot:CDW72188.1 mapeg family protein [Stylonychia lemnae]